MGQRDGVQAVEYEQWVLTLVVPCFLPVETPFSILPKSTAEVGETVHFKGSVNRSLFTVDEISRTINTQPHSLFFQLLQETP